MLQEVDKTGGSGIQQERTKYLVIRKLLRRKVAQGSLLIVSVALIFALLPGWFSPMDPFHQNISQRLAPPYGFKGNLTGQYLGTDQLGRDILSRIIYGARISLLVTFLAVLVSGLLGVTAGLLAGYHGGKLDLLIMRLIDIQLAFPLILLVIGIVAVVGPSLTNIIVVMGISAWPRYARIVRGSVLSVKEMEFIKAARSIGARPSRIMICHILPNVLSPLVVLSTFEIARMILLEATLSFLGLGVQPPNPTWGGMVNEGKHYIYMSWAVSTLPGLIIALVVCAFNMLGDEIRDAIDPQMSGD